jgi:hypothetical protein
LTYSNVVATLALFIAMGGTSYAVVRITGKNVVDGSLTGRDIKARSLAGRNLRDRSIGAGKLVSGLIPSPDVWRHVSADGAGARHLGTGQYCVPLLLPIGDVQMPPSDVVAVAVDGDRTIDARVSGGQCAGVTVTLTKTSDGTLADGGFTVLARQRP